MKFRTMNPWAASFGSGPGTAGEVLARSAPAGRVEVVRLDEGDDPVGMAAKIRAGNTTAPRSRRLDRRSRASFCTTAQMNPARRPPPQSRLPVADSLPESRGAASPTRSRYTCSSVSASSRHADDPAPASTSCATSSGLSPRGSATSTSSDPSTRGRRRHERERAEQVEERLRPPSADEIDPNRCRATPFAAARPAYRPAAACTATDPVAEPLRLVEVVRAHHDRAAGVPERGHEVAHRSWRPTGRGRSSARRGRAPRARAGAPGRSRPSDACPLLKPPTRRSPTSAIPTMPR